MGSLKLCRKASKSMKINSYILCQCVLRNGPRQVDQVFRSRIYLQIKEEY